MITEKPIQQGLVTGETSWRHSLMNNEWEGVASFFISVLPCQQYWPQLPLWNSAGAAETPSGWHAMLRLQVQLQVTLQDLEMFFFYCVILKQGAVLMCLMFWSLHSLENKTIWASRWMFCFAQRVVVGCSLKGNHIWGSDSRGADLLPRSTFYFFSSWLSMAAFNQVPQPCLCSMWCLCNGCLRMRWLLCTPTLTHKHPQPCLRRVCQSNILLDFVIVFNIDIVNPVC